jgi:hypothetical protein
MNYNPLTILRMREFGESVISHLASSDARLSGNVRVTHPDGSRSVVACAYPEMVGDWIFIFSLIDGFVLFGKDQVIHWQQGSTFEPTALGCTPLARSYPTRARAERSRRVA